MITTISMKIERLPKSNSVTEKPDFGAAIRQARMECGLSQQELAFEVGYKSATAISLIESNGRGIDATVLNQIAHITGKEIAWFFNPLH